MNTPLQQAAQAMIDRWDSTDWKDTPHTAHYVAELRKALDAELQQSVEPVAWTAQSTRTKKFGYIWHEEDDVEGWINLQHQSRDACTYRGPIPLYLHPPQPQATTPAAPTLTEALAQQGIKLRTEFEPKQRDSELATEPSGERAELIAQLRTGWTVMEESEFERLDDLCRKAADMIDADAQHAKRVPMTDGEIAEISERMEASDPTDSFWREFARAIEAHHGITPAEKPTVDEPEDLYALALKADNWGQP